MQLEPGTRVKIQSELIGLWLASELGVIVRPDANEGYYIVRLDSPAVDLERAGIDVSEVRVAADNLAIERLRH